ncbi:Chalcone and stilbene synthase, domain-containing protein [Cladophialophora immunda]|nr:Chalcone and stilbene synthase, domain-containing protein [Cladophialophora immunda]
MSAIINSNNNSTTFVRPNLHILGIGVQCPPHDIKSGDLATLARRFYPRSPALQKILSIDEYTGIETRLSVAACQKALEQWGCDISEITHMVSTTCTNSANPGFDHFVVKALGLDSSIEKVLLHGVDCSGGLAALRTAANIALGSRFLCKPARILVSACEISSVFVSDCASAVVLGNGFGNGSGKDPLLELLGWEHRVIEGTTKELGFNIDPFGWKVVLTQSVPEIASAAVPTVFQDMISSLESAIDIKETRAADSDWALDPGGTTVISGVQKSTNLTEENLRASYEVYITHGNSSSKDHVAGCAFGPGIALEMMLFKKVRGSRPDSERLRGALIAEEVD